MLPSKGYFKSLNCPYFDNGFCDRPHCHFRHTRRDKGTDESPQLGEMGDQPTQINDILSDIVVGEGVLLGKDQEINPWTAIQQSPGTSFRYKPTPIAELKKRHIPVTTAPSVTLSTSHKRRIEYDVKAIRKPKVEYVPEALSTDLCSGGAYSTSIKSVYRATKITDQCEQLLNGTYIDGNALLQGNEDSEDEIDFDQVSSELNFLDEILKEYENKPDTNEIIVANNLLDESSDFKKVVVEKSEEIEQGDEVPKVVSEKVTNGFLNNSNASEQENEIFSSELGHIVSSDSKKHRDSSQKAKTSNFDSTAINNCTNITERSKKNSSRSRTSSSSTSEHKSSSDHKQKSSDHHKSENDKNKKKIASETSSGSSEKKTTKRDQESDSTFDKLKKSESHHSSSSSKHSKREHSSSKTQKKGSEHKSNSSKSSRKNSEQDSRQNRSSKNESDCKNSSSTNSRKESEHRAKPKKSSKSEPDMSSRKRVHSPESHSSSKKRKEDSNSNHKQSERYKSSSKSKDENKHRKESKEKMSSRGDRSYSSKENIRKGKDDKENRERRKRVHSVSESEQSSDDDVEIISEPESIIVIDSEEDTDSEKSTSSKRRRVEEIESSPSPARSMGIPSPAFPSDVSDESDAEEIQNSQNKPIPVNNGSNSISAPQEDLLDHRVQSRIKNRVSLGTAWRPPTRKPVDIMTPAQRLLLFAKLREEEKESDAQSNAGRVRIGCVPNVKLLLEEKERLLKRSSNNNIVSSKKLKMMSVPLPIGKRVEPELDKDEPPKVVRRTVHPTKTGADIYTRQRYIEKLYNVERNLVLPGRPYEDAKNKCLESESLIWSTTKYDTYEKQFNALIQARRAEISSFTLQYYHSIRPRQSVMFPAELQIMKKGPDNREEAEQSLYMALIKHKLTDEELEAEGYPRRKPSSENILAYISQASLDRWKKPKGLPPRGEYTCANCYKFYAVDDQGLSIDAKECQYHAKKSWEHRRGKGGIIRRYKCCNGEAENPCMLAKYHSTELRDFQNLEGFIETQDPLGPEPKEGWGIFAVDCEMYWSTRGLELGRVTVVNAESRVVYDTLVKPEKPVTDYCTRMSGLTEQNLKKATTTLRKVQEDLLTLFSSKTVLIGHSLENDLRALQIIHSTVVDTAMVFKSGDRKEALKKLATDLLKEAIQNDEDGHDSAEDAITCLKLMKLKIFKEAEQEQKKKAPVLRYNNSTRDLGLN